MLYETRNRVHCVEDALRACSIHTVYESVEQPLRGSKVPSVSLVPSRADGEANPIVCRSKGRAAEVHPWLVFL